jgi:surfeit locus 1 family protein
MLSRLKLVPTLFTIPSLIILVSLGVWQLQRMEWKADLISKLQERSTMAAEPLPQGDLSMDDMEFMHVKMTGHFLNESEMFLLNRSLNGNPGLHVITPFQRDDVPGAPVILVNRGWVPFDKKEQSTREEGLVDGQTTVNGIVRFQRPITGLQHVFLPENELERNMWYSINSTQMGNKVGTSLPNYYVVDGNDTVQGLFPVGRQWRLDIPNNHLQYALTWFFLAIALAVIFVLYHRPPKQDPQSDA